MPTLIARLFSGRDRGRRLRQAAPRLGGESLEPRLALAVTTGSQGFLAAGGVTAPAPGLLDTATSLTLNTFISTASQEGYFSGLTFQNFGTVSFDTTVGSSVTFASGPFGTFQSTSIRQASLIVTPIPNGLSIARSFYVLGTFAGGTFGGAVTPDPAPASLTIGFTQTVVNSVPGAISGSATMSIPPSLPDYLVAADDLGCTSTPRVYVINPFTGDLVASFTAYEAGFRGGVRVAIGDVDGDPTTQEVVTAPGPGRAGEVRVFSINGVELPGFRSTPFGAGYTRGLEVAVGDVDADGKDDLVAAESRGPGRVSVQKSTGAAFAPWKSFTAFGGTYTGGASVAVAGTNRIVVGSGVGMKPMVKLYDVAATPKVISQFAPTVPTGTGGVSVTAQRFTGPSAVDIMVAGGTNAKSAIGVYPSAGGAPMKTYNTFASRPKANSPVYAAAAGLAGGTVDTVFQSQGTGGVGGILKVNAVTGVVNPTFAPKYNGKPIAGPLRIATRASR